MLGVTCERRRFTGTIDLSSGGGSSEAGLSELYWTYEEDSVAYDRRVRSEQIDPTGHQGRLTVRYTVPEAATAQVRGAATFR
ncbi:MAG: hypothetical protein OXG64_07310 [Chloroflexi bacterium]|nr:hypothetical protein [Chloroflexota bacterium]